MPVRKTSSLGIDVYDQSSDALVGAVPFLGLSSADAVDLVRWGTNGFAFRVFDTTGSFPSEDQIVIVASDLVTSTGTTPIPILASVSPAKVYAGGPAYSMQVIGSGFTSASTVLINGSPRATTYVSGTSLTVQVSDSDIATIGQLNVQVTTPAPGGGTSNYAYASIDAPLQTTPTVTLTPSATAITTAQALAVTVAVSGGNGKATPTGSVVLSGGGFTSHVITLTGGTAIINIAAGSLDDGIDPLAVTYTPDTTSAAIYQSATGGASVTVTTTVKSPSTTTATAALPTITNEQTDTISVTVAGMSGQPSSTGAVSLMSGTYSTQQTLANCAASFTVPAGALNSGANTLTVTYSGDEMYAGSSGTASITVSQVVIATLTAGVSPGGSTTTNVTFSASSTYSGTMNLSCTLVSSPAGAKSLPTCSFNPTSVKIAAGGIGATVLTVQTKAASTAALIAPSRMNLFGFGGGTILAGLFLIGAPARRRRWMPMLALLLIVVVAGVVGCAGSGGSNSGSGGSDSGSGGSSVPATSAGTYTFTLTGVDSANSSITTSANAVIIVQ